jgi:uncharacterized MAPEG superfamily protein
MTTPFWCLGIVVVLPYLIAPITGYFKAQQLGTYDNASPRAQATELGGTGARSVWAQANAWEAVAVFSIAVFVNHLKGDADPARSALYAQVFVACRLLHSAFYMADLDKLRTVVFLVSMAAAAGLFLA